MRIIAPRFFALSTFLAGAILLLSGATPARAGRLGWVTNVLPLPVVEVSAYFASVAGVGLILLARGLQRRLDAAYHVTVWLLAGGVIFSVTSALDIKQAVVLSVMLIVLVPSKRYFYRKTSILAERFTAGWIAAIAIVVIGTVLLAIADYGSEGLGTDVFWSFGPHAQGPRAQRALVMATIALVAFAITRLLRPARVRPATATAHDLAFAEPIVAESGRAAAQLAFLGDKSLLFDERHRSFIMYGVAGQSWISLGDPVGPPGASAQLIEQFVRAAHRSGGWPVFYKAAPEFVHLYLEYALSVVKLGEIARVPLADFTLEGPARRNLRRVHRRLADDGCTFHMLTSAELPQVMPDLRAVSGEWLNVKRAREKGFSLGRFDPAFVNRSAVGIVRQAGRVIAFVTLWRASQHAEVEVDLMRYTAAAPAGIMRYALIEAMSWARAEGYAAFNLGMAPLSGIRSSEFTPIWNQVSLTVRGVGERYYNFKGLREFKEWFRPEWEPSYLVSPGGTRRPVVLANVASLISGGIGGVFRR